MALDLPALTAALTTGRDLAPGEAAAAASAMADPQVADASKEAFLLALARKGETAAEVTGFAKTYRALARRTDFGDWPAKGIDIVGTGGDRSGSFNISSASALIVAAAGVPVLKHGNRSITSKSGSADFLAGLGVALEATDAQLLRGLTQANFCYLYAPAFHPAFKAILGVRKKIAESGTKTVFNVLGPLINPAQPAHMVVGVYDERWVEPLAATLGELGVKILNTTAGSPYYNPHIQRPAAYPPSDGYQPAHDPLIDVARQVRVVREVRARAPDARIMFIDYFTIVPPRGNCPAVPIGKERLDASRAAAARLAAMTARVARQEGAELVRFGRMSRSHSPWRGSGAAPGSHSASRPALPAAMSPRCRR